jgi:hypothetical protein
MSTSEVIKSPDALLADHPLAPVMMMQGDSESRGEIWTFSTLSPRLSLTTWRSVSGDCGATSSGPTDLGQVLVRLGVRLALSLLLLGLLELEAVLGDGNQLLAVKLLEPAHVLARSVVHDLSTHWVEAYSSTGSTMRMTSKPFFLKISRKGESRAAARDSAVR